jgi:hypothetical protein
MMSKLGRLSSATRQVLVVAPVADAVSAGFMRFRPEFMTVSWNSTRDRALLAVIDPENRSVEQGKTASREGSDATHFVQRDMLHKQPGPAEVNVRSGIPIVRSLSVLFWPVVGSDSPSQSRSVLLRIADVPAATTS